MVHEITDATFDNVIKDNDVVVIDIWAEWCGPCKMIAPTVEAISNEREKVFVSKMDADTNSVTLTKYAVRNIPTILIFKNGELKDKQVGVATKDILLDKIDALT